MQSTIGVFLEMNHLTRHKHKLTLLFEKVHADAYATLIFIIISEKTFRVLDSIPRTSGKRLDYVNSKEFINSIVYSMCTVHSPKDKTIMLGECANEFLLSFIDAVNLYFESEFTIIANYSEHLLDAGFSDPFVCYKNKICISRPTGFLENTVDKETTRRDLVYMHSQQNNNNCSVSIELDPTTVDYLKFTTKASVVADTSGRYQREVFGKLRVVSNKRDENGEVVYTLKLDKGSVIHGSAENISGITPYLYTFHSHPYEAYLNHQTMFGFPSASDYMAMYTLYKLKAILHFVASVEGLYVISINAQSDMISKPQATIVKFINKHYNLEKKAVKDIKEYVKMVNDHGLFRLELIPWSKCLERKIKVSFEKSDGNCLIR